MEFNIHKWTYPKFKGFKIRHLNITSLSKHKDELAIFISEQPFDIICLNETRLDCSIDNSEVGIPGYDLARKDRNRNGGGVAIYLRDTISYIDSTDLIPDVAEAICLEIKKQKMKTLLISTWYRPPSSKMQFFDEFETFLNNAEKENKELVITGDFNCDLFKSEANSNIRQLRDLIDLYQLHQHIDQPTRITDLTQTLLDIIITKIDDPKTIESGVIELGISDHSLVYICRKIGIPNNTFKVLETRHYDNFNPREFQFDLSQAFRYFSDDLDPNFAWCEWEEFFLQIADTHAACKSKKSGKQTLLLAE